MPKHPTRRLLILFVLTIAVCLGGFAAWQYALDSLKAGIESALGPRGEAREINVGLSGVEILDLRIRAPENAHWPDKDEARAQRILIVPDILNLLTARLSIGNIRVEGAHVVLLRTKAGEMKIVPSLFEKPSGQPPSTTESSGDKKDGGGKTAFDIDAIIVSDGVIEFYDESVRATPVKLRIEQVQATVGKLRLPDLAGNTNLKINGIIKGNQQDGRLAIDGSFDRTAKECGLTTKLRGIDMTVLQAYLLKAAEAGVQRGLLDLDLKSSIAGNKLRAPGTLTLSGLELTAGSKSFMGLTRSVVVDMLKDRKDRISMNFILEGDIDDPRFSLNEQLTTRLGSSLAGMLGISLESLVREVGNVSGSSAKAIGESVDRLLDKQRGGKR
jgi:hypothetical protein